MIEIATLKRAFFVEPLGGGWWSEPPGPVDKQKYVLNAQYLTLEGSWEDYAHCITPSGLRMQFSTR